MTVWSAFYDYVLPEVPGCDPALADIAIRNAAVDLCEASLLDQVDLTLVDIVANTATYTVTPPSTEFDIVQIMDAWYLGPNGSKRLTPQTSDDLARNYGYWQALTSTEPIHYLQFTQDTVTLFQIPTVAVTGGLKLKVALRPSWTAAGVRDWVAGRYLKDIAFGAKGTLMAMPAKPWTNSELAKYNMAMFTESVSNATADRVRNYTRGSLQVNIPRIL